MQHALPIAGIALACAVLSGCGASNDPIAGRVSVDMGGHEVALTDCHVQRAPEVKTADDGKTWRIAVCNQSVVIQGDMLFVNGEAFGQLGKGDRVQVDSGRVSIHPH